MSELLPAMRFDFRVVEQLAGQLSTFQGVSADVLLLGGSKSPGYLRDALAALEKTLPKQYRLEFAGLDHSAPWNSDRGGRPKVVASVMLDFLSGASRDLTIGSQLGAIRALARP